MRISIIVSACLAALALFPSRGTAAALHDLGADWSDAANPNGVWAYREGTTVLPSVADWDPLSSPVPQPAWAPGQTIPAWFKSASDNPEGMDFLTGDVVVHSSLTGAAATNVTWTSPGDGVITISGGIWMVRDIGRSATWSVLLDGVVLSSGNVFSGDPNSRAMPFAFGDGAGGAVLQAGLAVTAADVVELRIERVPGFNGDFVAMTLQIADQLLFRDGFE